MSEIHRFPGHACRFFLQGRCLYEEDLNPGYDRSLQCRVLLDLERCYDHFLTQAEAFGLGEEAAGGLWERRFERFMAASGLCPDFVPGAGPDPDRDFPPCALRRELLCLKAAPPCQGACSRFRTGRDLHAETATKG